ncbi:class I SAM-dependent methyltransferase [Mycolicibacterium alvei]|uniref:S-adenosyl-L-methionine-dependent methyltransferase n=1 Tax=Mycolicibacterium alvei TaxID=67081 RepID=A0A6N4UWM1_9MYCO|nr:SAM-dependent methyltransferase [Mycolicibacterium alvei]MCV7001839.1 SAM-dependent methyltransferase [Mycolicibacterium alvei]BBX28233.1 hypothetical protein MALV_33580 [Mycolicibacterium alvei]
MPRSFVSHPADLLDPLDTFLITAVESGFEQVVFLASDLDPRPYQLPWPAGTRVYVVDHPAILDVKTDAMADTAPTTAVRGVPADISGNWPDALSRAGFHADRSTLWSVEGVLPFIPSDEQRRLVGDITVLSAPGSRLISEISVSPFRDDSDGDVAADTDMLTTWQWSFAASQYVTAYLTSERPTSEYEAVETVLDSVDHRRGGIGRRVHSHAGTHVLRRRRRHRNHQREGR